MQPYRYASPNIPQAAIRRFARRIAERFQPDKIILFGSYAYEKPHQESDVDLLVIMRTRNTIDQSTGISLAFERPFSFDLIVLGSGTPEIRSGEAFGLAIAHPVCQSGYSVGRDSSES